MKLGLIWSLNIKIYLGHPNYFFSASATNTISCPPSLLNQTCFQKGLQPAYLQNSISLSTWRDSQEIYILRCNSNCFMKSSATYNEQFNYWRNSVGGPACCIKEATLSKSNHWPWLFMSSPARLHLTFCCPHTWFTVTAFAAKMWNEWLIT